MTRGTLIIVAALVLSGCLSGKDGGSYTYVSREIAELDTVYSHDGEGNEQAGAGLGLAWRSYGDEKIPFLPAWYLEDPFGADNGPDEKPGAPGNPGHVLLLTPDSAYLAKVDVGPLLPQFEIAAGYAGQPCTFSRPTGFQYGPGGATDTVPLVFAEARLERAAGGVYFAAMVDTAASRLADPRVDFSMSRIAFAVADVKVTCPEP